MKKRADVLVFEKNLAPSREKAKTYIIAGTVSCNGKPVKNPSEMLEEDSEITVGEGCPFVSRGGYKLDKAVKEFNIDLKDKVCVDIGASTGGFTDCMLQNGAQFVYAVDVGYGQFDWKLRNSEKVCLMERTNARYLDEKKFDKTIDFASIDVSFISLKLIIPVLAKINSAKNHNIAALIKPQFEAGKDKVGKKGVVRDAKVHGEVINEICLFAQSAGYGIKGLTYSPVKGPNGNIEYLVYLEYGANCDFDFESIKNVVAVSHNNLV